MVFRPLIRERSWSNTLSVQSFNIVAEQRVLVADVEFTVGDDGMGPRGFVGAVRLFKTATLEVLLPVWFDQKDRAVLDAVIDSAVGEGHRAFGHTAFVAIGLVPQDFARRKVETHEITAPVSTSGARQLIIANDDTAMVVLHIFREPGVLGFESPARILAQFRQPTTVSVS